MKDLFEDFFQNPSGLNALRLFNYYKSEIENPVLMIKKHVGKIAPVYYLEIGGGDGKRQSR